MKQRSPERIIELYNWLWRRAAKGTFSRLKPSTWTGRGIYLLIPEVIRIKEAMKSQKYRDAVSVIIHSN